MINDFNWNFHVFSKNKVFTVDIFSYNIFTIVIDSTKSYVFIPCNLVLSFIAQLFSKMQMNFFWGIVFGIVSKTKSQKIYKFYQCFSNNMHLTNYGQKEVQKSSTSFIYRWIANILVFPSNLGKYQQLVVNDLVGFWILPSKMNSFRLFFGWKSKNNPSITWILHEYHPNII
jgi:hypothetical protein